jgi:hypothetical protein
MANEEKQQTMITVGALIPKETATSEAEYDEQLRKLQEKVPSIVSTCMQFSIAIGYGNPNDVEMVEMVMAELLEKENPGGKLEPVINSGPISAGGVTSSKTSGSV